MLAKNVTIPELCTALAAVNAKFDGNIKFKKIEPAGRHIRFTLTVISSRAAGARISHSGRHIAAACWHAHGTFFDALPEGAVIVANGENIRPGDEWKDRNIGGNWTPFMHSEACEC